MVNTRSSARNTRNEAAAIAAIAQGGNRALRKALGIKAKPRSPAAGRKKPNAANACGAEVARLRAEVARLQRIITEIKAGRGTAVQRAAPRSDSRTVNHFRKEKFSIGGQPYQLPEILWRESQVSNAVNRDMTQRRRADAARRALALRPRYGS